MNFEKIFFVDGDCLEGIKYLGIYHPWHSGNNPNFDEFSRRILDLKGKKQKGIDFFFDKINNILTKKDFLICSVPSSDKNNKIPSTKSRESIHYIQSY